MNASAVDPKFVNREPRVRPANFRSKGGTRIEGFLVFFTFRNS
jgi:hypothetical protein